MASSRSMDNFMISLLIQLDASIDLESVSVERVPGSTSFYSWNVIFTYVTGAPAATAFRLNSADGLTGSFSPSAPEGFGAAVKNGSLAGIVQRLPGVDTDVTYNGTITIIQV